MISFTIIDEYAAMQRHKDLLAEVENERKHSVASIGRSPFGFVASWMIALGSKLENWGCRLQSKYEIALRKQQTTALAGAKYFLGEKANARNC